MKIAFLHPDLGIGGAERLIVDAAVALKSKGHEVCVFTNHHDPNHCFDETKNGTLKTVVIGDSLPRTIFGSFYALCAYIRMVFAAFHLVFKSGFEPDVYVCDQISAAVPVLKWRGAKVVFYCHFPDLLLTDRKRWWKKIYRFPLDWVEEVTTGKADVVLVNSNFTAGVFKDTFSSLRNTHLRVIHPTINVKTLLRPLPDAELEVKTDATTIFLSINRYERKKNVQLAIEAIDCLRRRLPLTDFAKIHLIIAGGYDERVDENITHFSQLTSAVDRLHLNDRITFLKSPSDDHKRLLFHCCTAVLYTPSNEHFGIVPLEAMLLGRPVLACASGGPLETVVDEQTGFLCEPTAEGFATRMAELARDRSLARELGVAAAEHVKRNFSFESFATKLNKVVQECVMV